MQYEYNEKYKDGKLVKKNEIIDKIKYLNKTIDGRKIDIFVDDI